MIMSLCQTVFSIFKEERKEDGQTPMWQVSIGWVMFARVCLLPCQVSLLMSSSDTYYVR
ncbi:hypothetical protein Hanom_Chr08g00738251 [Helianthus anomalus]